MRVVVYAEGARELYGEFVLPRTPTLPLSEEDLGAAHALVRRTIDFVDPSRAGTIQFDEPLRLTPGARIPRGSDLRDRKNLRRLLVWQDPRRRPDLAVVLIDEDGDVDRLSTVRSHLDPRWFPPVVLGVAIREFESWLIGDMQAVRNVLAVKIDEPRERESMEPRRAKQLLDEWLEESAIGEEARVVRRRIAESLRVDELKARSNSFRRFLDELREAMARVVQSRS